MKSPTGRIVDYASFRRQEEIAMAAHHRLTRVLDNTPGVKKVAPDCYEITDADYASLELRIMATMNDGKTDTTQSAKRLRTRKSRSE